MALVKISRGADIQHNYVNGVSRVSILEGAYKDATVERISLQPGADFSAELYTREQHNQVFLITAGKGYIVTPPPCIQHHRGLRLCPRLRQGERHLPLRRRCQGDHGDRPLCHRAQRL